MLLNQQILQSLSALKGLSSQVPKTVGWSSDGSPAVEIDFTAVDSLGCAFRELRIAADGAGGAAQANLGEWARTVCAQVTYLLEDLSMLEVDSDASQILVRSAPPSRESNAPSYYELIFRAPSKVSLRRYNASPVGSGREPVDMKFTNETLLRLVRDLVAALPAPSGE